jgi:PAS domain S-box-containing protein
MNTQNELLKSEAYNRLLFNSSPIGLALCKMDGSLIDVNPAYANLLGRTIEETLKLSYWDITPKKYEDQEKQQIKSLDETGRYGPYEKEYIHKDGHLVPVRLQGSIFEQEGERFIWSSVEDITERKSADEKEKEYLRRITNIFERISDGFVAFDSQMNYTYVSARGGEMLERPPQDLIGKNYWKEYPEAKGTPFANAYLRALETQTTIIIEDYYAPFNRWFENRIYPSKDGLAIFFSDVTERKLSEHLLVWEKQVLERISTRVALDEELNSIVLGIESLSKETIASILLLDIDSKHVHHSVAPHLPGAYNQALKGAPIGPRAGSCGTAAYRKEPVIVTDIETDPLWDDYRELARAHGLRSCWSTPIINQEGNVLGTFAMYYREPRSPVEKDFRLIERATHLAGIAIERKRSEEALISSEVRIRNIFEQANDGIYIISAENRYLDANARGLELLGYTLDELLQMSVADVLATYEVERLKVEPPRMMSGIPHLAEWDHVRKDGSTFPGEVSARRLDDHSYLAIVRDLTERRRIEAAMRASEERLRLSTELANVAVWEYNFITNSMSRSKNHDQLYGLEWQAKWDLNTFTNATHPDDRQFSNDMIQKSVAANGPDEYQFDFRVVYPDQTIHWLNVVGEVVERDSEGKGTIVRGCLIDITERKRAEEELRESEERYRLIQENSMDAILLTAPDGSILSSNPAACEMFQRPEEEICRIGRN